MKLTDLKNPLKADKVDVLSPSDWLGSIGYIAFLGACVAIGAKALIKIDNVTPGNITPNGLAGAVAKPATNTVVVY